MKPESIARLFSRRAHRGRGASSARGPSLVVRRTALGFGTILALALLLSFHFLPDRVNLRVGDRSPTEIRAARSVTYQNTTATRLAQEYKADRVGLVYVEDAGARPLATRSVSELFGAARRLHRDASVAAGSKEARLSEELGGVLEESAVRTLVLSPPATLDRLESIAHSLTGAAMERDVRAGSGDLAAALKAFENDARKSVARPEEVAILAAVGRQAIRPNRVPSPRKTEELRQLARQLAEPVTGELRAGDVVIRSGEVFTQLHADMCSALGLINPRIDWVEGLSLLGLATCMVLGVSLYIRRALPRLYESPARLFLLAALATVGVFGLRFFDHLLGIPFNVAQFGYLGMTMVVSAGMLITVLLDANLAILVTALLSIVSGLIMNHEIRFPVMTLFSSLAGVYAVHDIRQRSDLVRATAIIALVNVVLVGLLGGLLGDTGGEVLAAGIWGGVAAGLCIGIFWFGVAVLERPFGILTHVWLLELSSSERPLIRELCVTAPGTYAHSVAVGTLAEAAAESVGADSLFCRVASLYHDVGKMKRPHCFVENQRAENIHDKLNPSLSALIIASHVRDGLELGQQRRLPVQILDIIREHHGTSLIRYFYHQALSGSDQPHDPVLEQHFRYEGPKPQTRESGIIMLADAVEAAARCVDKPTPARLESLVVGILQDKLTDGQLDECDLTYKDLQKVRRSFVKSLGAMLHGRVDYPELPASGHPLLDEAPLRDSGLPQPAGEPAEGGASRGSRGNPEKRGRSTS